MARHRAKEQRPNSAPFRIEPFTFTSADWDVWYGLLEQSDDRRQALMADLRATGQENDTKVVSSALLQMVTKWVGEVDAWLRGFDATKRADLCKLLRAEIGILHDIIDPAAHAPSGYYPTKPTVGSDDFLRFRERFFSAEALIAGMVRCGFHDVEGVRGDLERLRAFAEQREWLP